MNAESEQYVSGKKHSHASSSLNGPLHLNVFQSTDLASAVRIIVFNALVVNRTALLPGHPIARAFKFCLLLSVPASQFHYFKSAYKHIVGKENHRGTG